MTDRKTASMTAAQGMNEPITVRRLNLATAELLTELDRFGPALVVEVALRGADIELEVGGVAYAGRSGVAEKDYVARLGQVGPSGVKRKAAHSQADWMRCLILDKLAKRA